MKQNWVLFSNSFKRLESKLKFVFFLFTFYLIIYESILTQIPSPNPLFYKLGKGLYSIHKDNGSLDYWFHFLFY